MNSDQLWATMDTDERNLRLDSLRNRSMAAFIALSLSTVFVLGPSIAMFLGGVAANITYLVMHRRMTRMLLSSAKS